MSTSAAQVTVVIVMYHSRGTIDNALHALKEAHDQGFAQIVAVDNASSDGTADYVAEHFPWVKLIRSDENLGYGRGCNKGLQHARTPFVLILNPDAAVSLAALRTMVDFLQQTPQAGIVAPAIREGSGHQDAGLMTTPGTVLRGAFGSNQPYPHRKTIEPGDPPFQTNWVCGAVMLIRTDLFRSLNGFDPRFFLYFEETDLCRRAAATGAQLWATGEAVVDHIGGASAKATGARLERSCIAQHYYRSRFYYLIKHFGWCRAVAVEMLVGAAQCVRFVRDRLLRRSNRPSHERARPFLRLPATPSDAT